MKYKNIREEELKNHISEDYFSNYDCNNIIGNVDFCVALKNKKSDQNKTIEMESLLWAEAKRGSSDIIKSIVQLILTIGKARTFDKNLPPAFIGAFDGEKIAFIPYNKIYDLFYENDFNWNVTPSNYQTKEFETILKRIQEIFDNDSLIFYFGKDDLDLKQYIKANFVFGKSESSKIKIDKNNFISIYNKWLKDVKPSILVNWEISKSKGVIDGDFYLADLLSENNHTLKENLFIVLNHKKYEIKKKVSDAGWDETSLVSFRDDLKAHTKFWQKYERPPKHEYWEYIISRRDLLVPQDVREIKGSFFTPLIWVDLAHKYLSKELGENWQDEYYIWDCAAGTGNLLVGLTNKYNIWASTLDKQDVDVMKDRVKNGANLLERHIFQFDFLNDDFDLLPKSLSNIINDPIKREKLIILINPPYAEATTLRTVTGTGENKVGVSINHKVNEDYNTLIGNASNELFALFMTRIYENLSSSILAQFSTLKFIQGTNFLKFKNYFLAKFLKGFVVPANSFDNVNGKFPIGFTIWDLKIKERISTIKCQVYDNNEKLIGEKVFYGDLPESINKWINKFPISDESIALLVSCAPDFQHNNQLVILSKRQERYCFNIGINNLIHYCVYFSVRHCIEANWLNNRDQFLHPNELWKDDEEFYYDCLTFTIFNSQNKVTSKDAFNHFIPFSESDLGASDNFKSNLIYHFINGKMHSEYNIDKFDFEPVFDKRDNPIIPNNPIIFSKESILVFNHGKKLWQYYHSILDCNVNASLYDIKEYFQGRNDKGKMNNKSDDETYMKLIGNLRDALKVLAKKIEPKVYEYGFLKE